MVKVDVIVPCHNYGHFLKACVRSVLAQTGVEVNVLVVDDASTDKSASVATALAQEDSRVRVISLPKNLGMIRAVNLGLREIDGQYVVKLDADDLLPLGSLERSVALLERYPNVGFVYGWARFFTGDLPPRDARWTLGAAAEWLASCGVPRWTIWSGIEWLTLRYRRASNCIAQPEVVVRTSTLRTVGEYDVGLPHTSDLQMWLRLAAVADVGRINGVVQGYYRVHPNSMQRTVHAGLLNDLVRRRDAFLSALSTGRKRQREDVDLEAAVRQKLAVEALDNACRAFESAGS